MTRKTKVVTLVILWGMVMAVIIACNPPRTRVKSKDYAFLDKALSIRKYSSAKILNVHQGSSSLQGAGHLIYRVSILRSDLDRMMNENSYVKIPYGWRANGRLPGDTIFYVYMGTDLTDAVEAYVPKKQIEATSETTVDNSYIIVTPGEEHPLVVNIRLDDKYYGP